MSLFWLEIRKWAYFDKKLENELILIGNEKMSLFWLEMKKVSLFWLEMREWAYFDW